MSSVVPQNGAQTALVLRSVPDQSSLVDVTVPKNRAYRREPFRLHLDHASTLFTETEMPVSATPEGGRSASGYTTAAMRRAVVDAVGGGELRSARAIVRAVRESGNRFTDRDLFDVVRTMQEEGALARDGGRPFRIEVPPTSDTEAARGEE